ncbi:MAG TPA: hypothetical protein VL309_11980 [Vicinamibacterales bacterium]|jgi:hypothetical protein|nr:hypothetical protein [Vicinamibacterales bacterium]
MTARKLLCTFVAVSMLAATVPPTVSAAESTPATSAAAATNLRTSIDRAAARAAANALPAVTNRRVLRVSTEMSPMQGGGGGSKTMLVMMLVGTAASVGAGYLIYKQMKKQTGQTN